MTLIQWLCGLAGHRWDWQVRRCVSCNVTEAAWIYRPRLFGNRTGYIHGSNAREDQQRSTWRNWYVTLGGWRVGFQYAPLFIKAAPYMTRYIVYLGPINLRLHQFFRGDDDRAPHNHPWWFITFPFRDYVENVYDRGQYVGPRVVRAFRFHYRKASHEHIVIGPMALRFKGAPVVWGNGCQDPFWTFVIAGSRVGEWGFYPEPGVFVPWQAFKP